MWKNCEVLPEILIYDLDFLFQFTGGISRALLPLSEVFCSGEVYGTFLRERSCTYRVLAKGGGGEGAPCFQFL